jgi:hypothetical protein
MNNKKIIIAVFLLALVLVGLASAAPAMNTHTLSGLASIQGGLSQADCAVGIVCIGLGLLAGAAFTGGVGLALAGAYVPLLAAAC